VREDTIATVRKEAPRPAAPVDDVVPAVRPITVADLLTFRAGYGFPSDFSLPGGTGTAAHIIPSTGTVTILLSQVELAGASAPA
jgi:hypothetical protein